MINRGWNPRIQETVAYQPRSGLNLDTLKLQLSVLEPDGLLLSLFGACLYSMALMIRFAPLQLQRVNRALGSAAWRSQEIGVIGGEFIHKQYQHIQHLRCCAIIAA